jgi:hypothetical protein
MLLRYANHADTAHLVIPSTQHAKHHTVFTRHNPYAKVYEIFACYATSFDFTDQLHATDYYSGQTAITK